MVNCFVCRESAEVVLGAMAVSVRVMALIIGFCGVVSFIFGVIAENKKVKSRCYCRRIHYRPAFPSIYFSGY